MVGSENALLPRGWPVIHTPFRTHKSLMLRALPGFCLLCAIVCFVWLLDFTTTTPFSASNKACQIGTFLRAQCWELYGQELTRIYDGTIQMGHDQKILRLTLFFVADNLSVALTFILLFFFVVKFCQVPDIRRIC